MKLDTVQCFKFDEYNESLHLMHADGELLLVVSNMNAGRTKRSTELQQARGSCTPCGIDLNTFYV
jgi:hypothetical protein